MLLAESGLTEIEMKDRLKELRMSKFPFLPSSLPFLDDFWSLFLDPVANSKMYCISAPHASLPSPVRTCYQDSRVPLRPQRSQDIEGYLEGFQTANEISLTFKEV